MVKENGGIFGRNPTFNNVDIEGSLTVNGEPISDFGTMAQQDANSVNIDGGNIDGTVIGASSPEAISGTTGDFSGGLTAGQINSTGAVIATGAGSFGDDVDIAGDLIVDTNTLFVDATGKFVGIGTTSKFVSDGYLHVSVASSGKGAWVSSVGSGSTRGHMRFENANGLVGTISTSNLSTIYGTSSDYRLKEDVQPMVGSVDRLMAMKPVNFAWKADGSRVDGFLAHEAQEIVPEAVTGEKDEIDDNGQPIYQGIDQSKLVPLLTAALQEALTRIEALEQRVGS